MISAHTRRQAILALDIGACSADGLTRTTYSLGLTAGAERLAWDAYNEVLRQSFHRSITAWRAEAAGLLRDGWSPGDDSERL